MSQTTETKTKTPVERLEEWIAALRSGKYEQGQAALRDADNRFCCLGVACDLHNPKRWTKLPHVDSFNGPSSYGYDLVDINALPPDTVSKRFGLSRQEVYHLARLNDGGRSFSEIADYIESTVLPRVRREQEGQ